MSWDNEKTLSFIKEYEKRPILWQKSDKFYYNVIKKEDAWREISEICDEDIAVLKKKIESLRGSRRREKNRILQNTGTGKGRNDIYISKWFAWDALKFLEDPEEIRTTISNYAEEITQEEPIQNLDPNEAINNSNRNSDDCFVLATDSDNQNKENNAVAITTNAALATTTLSTSSILPQ
ncbi:uncharacterized protein [Euwallacea fornicatus]|uniref:uncharacterized protein isoform X2 n=1 Tax=Euwallacea fornicatus TaxID=995702 RepID=UPI00338E6C9C